MGIRDLMTYAQRQGLSATRKLADLPTQEAPPVLVVDGGALLFRVSKACNLPVELGGGSLEELRLTRQFARTVRAAVPGTQVVVVFGGYAPEAKDSEARSRRCERAQMYRTAWYACGELVGAGPRGQPGLFTSSVVALGLQQEEGVTSVYAEGEADSEIVRQAKATGVWGVLSDDSDLLVHSRAPLLLLKSLSLNRMDVDKFDTGSLARHLGLDDALMPLFSCLCGNDWTRDVAPALRMGLGLDASKPLFETVAEWLCAATPVQLADLVGPHGDACVRAYYAEWAALHGATLEVAPVPAAAPAYAPAASQVPAETWLRMEREGRRVGFVSAAVSANRYTTQQMVHDRTRDSPADVTQPIRRALYGLVLAPGSVVREVAVRGDLKAVDEEVRVPEDFAAPQGLAEVRGGDAAAKLAFVWNVVLGLGDSFAVPAAECSLHEVAALCVAGYLSAHKRVTRPEMCLIIEYLESCLDAYEKSQLLQQQQQEAAAAAEEAEEAPESPEAAEAQEEAAGDDEDGWTSVAPAPQQQKKKGAAGQGQQAQQQQQQGHVDEDRSKWGAAVHLHSTVLVTLHHVRTAFEAVGLPLPDDVCMLVDGLAFRHAYCRKGKAPQLSERSRAWIAALQRVHKHDSAPEAAGAAAAAPVAQQEGAAPKAAAKAKAPAKPKAKKGAKVVKSANVFDMLGDD
eukprot:m51a1_g11447 hypothetical protein (683) ;mRNA; r:5626-7972